MEESLSGTLAIDLGNTNTVVAFQDQKDINSVLVEIPNITSSPGVIPSAVWFEEPSKITKIGVSALKMRDCLLYTSPSPRDRLLSRMPSSA